MGSAFLLAALALASVDGERATVSRARQLYNARQYDEAMKVADAVRKASPATADEATLILARARLERFRVTSDPVDLAEARAALRLIDPAKLPTREGVEFVVGLAEALYFDGQFGPAAELFDGALTTRDLMASGARERLLAWWADALSRRAAAGTSREGTHARIVRRMEEELQRNPLSAVASYWLVVSARGAGDLDRAWDAAVAAWVRAPRANPGSAGLRTDLDRYVTDVLIPERARRPSSAEESARSSALRAEWEALKQQWIGQ